VYSNTVNQLAATPSAVSRNNQILSRTQWTSLHHSQTTYTADRPSGPAYITHRPHTQPIDPSGPAYITHRPHTQLGEYVR